MTIILIVIIFIVEQSLPLDSNREFFLVQHILKVFKTGMFLEPQFGIRCQLMDSFRKLIDARSVSLNRMRGSSGFRDRFLRHMDVDILKQHLGHSGSAMILSDLLYPA